jgi:type I site-specific restriction endonuclease
MVSGQERAIVLKDFPSPEEMWTRYCGDKQYTPEQAELVTEPYFFQVGDKTPRYYQRIAINRTIEAISRGQNRILLVMATGTGKTYTAFQIIHRLWKARRKRKILYLADRNILIDQTMQQDFKPFEKVMTKVKGKDLNSAFEIYMSLYHQLAGDENEEPFRQFTEDFFDLIIVDECHRGSAKEESRWRKILEYFSGATHIGMTATPKETQDVSSSYYFGAPLYSYSLKQGIDDGFLAPFKVIRILIDKDAEGYRPPIGKLDVAGNPVEDKEYNTTDFDRNLVIDERTLTVAHRITDTVLSQRVQYYDVDGKLITESITDYSKKNILGEYATLDDFLKAWNSELRKQAIIDELKERGVLLDALRDESGKVDLDDFDLICHIAFDKRPLTKAQRAANVKARDYLSQYEGIAREVLSALLDKYASDGIADISDTKILRLDPFRNIAGLPTIIKAFGGEGEYISAIKQLQEEIYQAA